MRRFKLKNIPERFLFLGLAVSLMLTFTAYAHVAAVTNENTAEAAGTTDVDSDAAGEDVDTGDTGAEAAGENAEIGDADGELAAEETDTEDSDTEVAKEAADTEEAGGETAEGEEGTTEADTETAVEETGTETETGEAGLEPTAEAQETTGAASGAQGAAAAGVNAAENQEPAYDIQPTTIEEVQEWIDDVESLYFETLEAEGFLVAVTVMNEAKPHWEYEVEEYLMPDGYYCGHVTEDIDETDFGAEYYTFFSDEAAYSDTAAKVYDADDSSVSLFIGSLPNAVNYVNGEGDGGNIGNEYLIYITEDIILGEMLPIKNPEGVTIMSDPNEGNTYTIMRSAISKKDIVSDRTRHFKVTEGGVLTLENITLDGGWGSDNAESTDIAGIATFSNITLGTATLSDADDSAGFGGGVWVSGGIFTMKTEAAIQFCYRTDAAGTGGQGGGVYVDAGSSFTMNGGEIRHNYAVESGGGVYVMGEFTMNGGAIILNQTGGHAGGICANNAAFYLNHGEISGNFAKRSGGAVSVVESYFKMTGGIIAANVTLEKAGGIWVGSGSAGYKTWEIGKDGGEKGGWTYDSGDSWVYNSGSEGFAEKYTSVFIMTGGTIGSEEKLLFDSDINGDSVTDAADAEENYKAGAGNYALDNGAGVMIQDNSYFLMNGSDAKIIGNNTGHISGGVAVSFSIFRLRDGEISYNETTSEDGVFSGSGGVGIMSGEFYMEGGVVSHNHARGLEGSQGNGGGVWAGSAPGSQYGQTAHEVRYTSTFVMSGGEISHNSAANSGGGIFVNRGGGFYMKGGDIINNTSAGCGGGVAVAGAEFTMTGGYISGNRTAATLNLPTSGLQSYGGGVWIGHASDMEEADSTNAKGSTFTMNGGIIGGEDGYYSNNSPSIAGGEYYGNFAGRSGGGVYIGGDSTFTMSGSAQINFNRAEETGGGVYVGSGNYNIDANEDGTADSHFTMEGGYILNNQSVKHGGGVYIAGAEFIMMDGYISSNRTTEIKNDTQDKAGATSGGVYVGQDTGRNFNGRFNMAGGLIGGTALYNNTIPSVAGSMYYGNYSACHGGGVYGIYAAIEMTGGSIAYNTASGQQGGGMCLEYSTFEMSDAVIEYNEGSYGGGVSLQLSSSMIMNQGAYVQYNKADTFSDSNSGGILITSTGSSGGAAAHASKLTMKTGSLVTGNTARGSGGGIQAEHDSILKMETGSKVSDNIATNTQGGGVFCQNAYVDINAGAEITGNHTGGIGGGIAVANSSAYTCTISGTISNNTAQTNGGGIYSAEHTAVTLAGAAVEGNIAQQDGGGIYTSSSNLLTVTDGTKIKKNVALGSGGGIYTVADGYSNLRIDASTAFSGNRAAFAVDRGDSSKSFVSTNYIPDSIASVSIYKYALNNWDINSGGELLVYTIIFDPNGGAFSGGTENLQYLYVFAIGKDKPLTELGYVLNDSGEITYLPSNDKYNNAEAVNRAIGSTVIEETAPIVDFPARDSSQLVGWNTDKAAGTGMDQLLKMPYCSSISNPDFGFTSPFAPSSSTPVVYAQWNTYKITLELDGITWEELAGNVAVNFTDLNGKSMKAIFTETDNCFTPYPAAGRANGIQSLGTTPWAVTASLPGYYSIDSVTTTSGTVSATDGIWNVTPTNAGECEIVIAITKGDVPWGKWIYK